LRTWINEAQLQKERSRENSFEGKGFYGNSSLLSAKKNLEDSKSCNKDLRIQNLGLGEKLATERDGRLVTSRGTMTDADSDPRPDDKQKLLDELKATKGKLKDSERECLILDSKLNRAQDQYLDVLETKSNHGSHSQPPADLSKKIEILTAENNRLASLENTAGKLAEREAFLINKTLHLENLVGSLNSQIERHKTEASSDREKNCILQNEIQFLKIQQKAPLAGPLGDITSNFHNTTLPDVRKSLGNSIGANFIQNQNNNFYNGFVKRDERCLNILNPEDKQMGEENCALAEKNRILVEENQKLNSLLGQQQKFAGSRSLVGLESDRSGYSGVGSTRNSMCFESDSVGVNFEDYGKMKKSVRGKDREIERLKKENGEIQQVRLKLEAHMMSLSYQHNTARRNAEFSNFENRSLSPFSRTPRASLN
jgi:hypothetical protein